MSVAPDAGWGTLTDKTKSVSTKVRLSQILKNGGPPKPLQEIMGELRALDAKDMDDFTAWFNAAGYPSTNTPATA